MLTNIAQKSPNSQAASAVHLPIAGRQSSAVTSVLAIARWVMLLLLLFILDSCHPKTVEANLPFNTPAAFSPAGEEVVNTRWWKRFNDPVLNDLMEQALDSNLNLTAAWYRVQEALAVVDRESSFLLPDIEATMQAGTSYPRPDFVGGENLRFGLLTVYEADLWGRIRANLASEKFRAEATALDYQAAALTLSAELARSWYQLMAAWQLLKLIEEQIETNQTILKLIKARFGIGQLRAVDVLRQQQLVEETLAEKIAVEARIGLLEHQLLLLLGLPPQQGFAYEPQQLPPPPPLPQAGVPAVLLNRRPDVQRSFKLLAAADRALAAAISSQYPRFSLSAAPSLRANNAESLFQDWAYSLAGNLTAPLFYGGRLSAEVDRNEAIKNQRIYEWGQTVLIALREVEDALLREQKQAERLLVLEEQLQLASLASEQLKIAYFNGISDYLSVLTALQQEQLLRRNLITARLNLLEFRIALYRSLAGSIEPMPEPED